MSALKYKKHFIRLMNNLLCRGFFEENYDRVLEEIVDY